jgi:hypothetical protein
MLEGNPPALEEPVERRIERALLDVQLSFGTLLDGLGNRVAMTRTNAERVQYEHVQSALEQL